MNLVDWDSDPELKELRNDFIDSLAKRAETLASLMEKPALGSGQNADQEIVAAIRVIVHNLAGTASTYGFTHLGEVSISFDDFISLKKGLILREQLLKFSKLFENSLKDASQTRQDRLSSESLSPADQETLNELISCVESLVLSAKP